MKEGQILMRRVRDSKKVMKNQFSIYINFLIHLKLHNARDSFCTVIQKIDHMVTYMINHVVYHMIKHMRF